MEALSNLLVLVQKCHEEVDSNKDSISNFEYSNREPEHKRQKFSSSSENLVEDCIVGNHKKNQKPVFKDIKGELYFNNKHKKAKKISPKEVDFDLNTIESIESYLFHKNKTVSGSNKELKRMEYYFLHTFRLN